MSIPDFPDGIYTISLPNDLVATVIPDSQPFDLDSPILLLPFTVVPEARWALKNLSNRNITLQNVATDQFLGFIGRTFLNKICVQSPTPVEWRLEQNGQTGRFDLVLAQLVEGFQVLWDVAPYPVTPPLTALVKRNIQNLSANAVPQGLTFVPVKES